MNIKPEMLVWAYERAGYNLQEAVRLCPQLDSWLHGRAQPTARQAEKYASKFYVPFGFLMMSVPPIEKPIIPMFRKGKRNSPGSINVFDTINQIAMRQAWMSDYLRENGQDPLPFVAKYKGLDLDEMVSAIRSILDLEELWAEQFRSSDDLVRNLAARIEDKGVAVSFNGVVGNNTHRIISVEDCRGFSLVDEYAPFIFVNNSDAKQAQYFTLIHEFVHILIGYGSSYGQDSVNLTTEENERYCDEVAARLVAPVSAFEAYWSGLESVDKMAGKLRVSHTVIARRAYSLHLISRDEFRAYLDTLDRQNEERMGNRSGGNFYPTAQKRLGSVFSAHVANAVRSGQLLYTEAYHLTGLHGDTFSKVLRIG